MLAAYDVLLDRRVALKLLQEERAHGEAAQVRLLREAQAMARLAHPNAVQVHDAGTLEDGRLFIAMEYVEGQNLLEWAAERSRAWNEVLAAYVAAGRGLAPPGFQAAEKDSHRPSRYCSRRRRGPPRRREHGPSS